MPNEHAKFSPSAAEQFIKCPPSLKLSEQFEDEGSEYAAERTKAHAVCEYMLKRALGESAEEPKGYDPEMLKCAEGYRDMVLEFYKPGDFISVEQRVSLEEYVPGSFSTSDCIIVGDGHIFVVDFKYGKGVQVSTQQNSQLKCYALRAYSAFSPLYEIEDITLVIYQPKINNFSEWALKAEDLLSWGSDVLKPRAALALKGEGEYSSGQWCRFCKAKAICRKLSEVTTDLAKYEFAEPATLSDDEINSELSKIKPLELWVKAIKDYALQRALSGHKWQNWKVVEGQSKRKFVDEAKVAEIVAAAGYDPYEKKLRGLTAMTKLLGRENFAAYKNASD